MAHRDADRATAAALLERLLRDAGFRARFRVDPQGALADAGVDAMAEQWSQLGEEVQTLDTRESRSSLAGAGVAAAIEGFALLGPVGDLVDAAQAADEVRSGQGGAQVPGDVVSPPPAPPAPPVASGDQLDEDDPELTPDDSASPAAPAPAAGPGGSAAPDTGDGESDSVGADEQDGEGDEDDEDENEDEGEEGAGWDALDEQTDNPETNPDDDSSSGDSGSDDSGSDNTDGSSDNTDGSSDNTDGSSDNTDGGSDNTDGSSDSTDGDSGAPGDYPGDDAKPAEVAAWMGAEARRRGIPPELPIMAALTESGMRNLDHGDRDSVGFFQMRVSVWDNGAYAGYAGNPKRQLDWFLDQARSVGRLRRGRGLSTTDPRQYGEWVADIERPAEQYRGRYQDHLADARSLLAQSRNGNGDEGMSDGADDLADVPYGPGKQALRALAEARKYMGTPYLWGGSSPKTGFDCSGLVQWAYAKAGIRIPRVTYDQIDAPNGRPVSLRKLLPGDLVFFKNASGDVHHVGMSLGGDKFMHAPHTGDVVKISSLKESYYAREFAGGRRFVAAVGGGHRAVDAVQGVAGARAEVQVASSKADAIEANVVKIAMAAIEEDNREILRPGSRLHQLLTRQESSKANAAMFLPAVSAIVDQP